MRAMKAIVLTTLGVSFIGVMPITACCQPQQGHFGDWNPDWLGNNEGSILTTSIEEIECYIGVSLSCDLMPVIPEGGPFLSIAIKISATQSNSLLFLWIPANKVTITQNTGITRGVVFTEILYSPTSSEYIIRKGPRWESGATASITFEVATGHLTSIARVVDETYTYTFNDVPINTSM